MIAHLREPSPVPQAPDRAMRQARRAVAESLLAHAESRTPQAAPIQPWVAWGVVAWIVVTLGGYVAAMAGWLQSQLG